MNLRRKIERIGIKRFILFVILGIFIIVTVLLFPFIDINIFNIVIFEH